MTEAEKRLHRCCFTGHRPEKLTCPENIVKESLEKEILKAISDGLSVFVSGMARGTDIWASEIVLRLRSEGYPIRLICASQYYGFEKSWSDDWQERYNAIFRNADLVRYISPGYSRSCFQKRNEWMVNHSARVIAVYNGQPGGTKNTIDYANKVNVPVIILQNSDE